MPIDYNTAHMISAVQFTLETISHYARRRIREIESSIYSLDSRICAIFYLFTPLVNSLLPAPLTFTIARSCRQFTSHKHHDITSNPFRMLIYKLEITYGVSNLI
jgi:hypothetical protein